MIVPLARHAAGDESNRGTTTWSKLDGRYDRPFLMEMQRLSGPGTAFEWPKGIYP
jgi:hypothetical protein